MKVENTVALVTGANRGIGRALVDALLAAGAARIYATARRPEQIAQRDRVVALRLDLNEARDVEQLAPKAGDVTLLINNAGVLGSWSLLTSPRADVERDFATNFFGTLDATRALFPVIERNGGGAIVNVLTVTSLASMPALGGYSAAKAAAFSMTQALRAELKPRKIAVHSVFPGPVDTEMTKAISIAKTRPEVVARAIVEGIARGEEDILPDPMAREVFATWTRDPKALERQFANM
jgi:NAD(P)-dependent dehydrogenase (short-subunit alcohol dehydrogenase family)